jgi:hypothetical protein
VAKPLPGGAGQAEFLQREVQRGRALAHPGLVAVRGGGREGSALYVLSEYCEGGRCVRVRVCIYVCLYIYISSVCMCLVNALWGNKGQGAL